jgi:peptidoglycan/xylan/chitin deacetylase (PgdA/CDA1 family)
MDPDTVFWLVCIGIAFLAGLWVGRHPERVRQAEERIVARIHARTAPHIDPPKSPPPGSP